MVIVMGKKIEYPRASLAAALDVGNAVYELGGHSSVQTCADKMNKKVSGAFQALISAADKFGFIDNQRGDLTSTDLFNQYKHAYSDEEEQSLLRRAFLSSGVFYDLYERFRGMAVPEEILDRILVREFDVPPQAASRISGYFTHGAKQVGLLDEENKLIDFDGAESEDLEKTEVSTDQNVSAQPSVVETNAEIQPIMQSANSDAFSVQFRGPGLNTTIEISEEHDVLIVNAVLQKIMKKMGITLEEKQ